MKYFSSALSALSFSLLFDFASAVPTGFDSHLTTNPAHKGLAARASKPPAVYTQCVNPGQAAITFDDGPYIYESTIVKALNSKKAKATFFLNGNNWQCIYSLADEIQATYKAGHLIGSHTWTHIDITKATDARFKEELDYIETAFKKILGIKPKFFRPPYGAYNDHALSILQARGYEVVTWSWDSQDSWTPRPSANAEIAEYKALAKTFAQGNTPIMLNHETYQQTSQIVTPALKYLKEGGWELVTVAECLGFGTDPKNWYQAFYTPSKPDDTWTCVGSPVVGS